MHSHSVSDIIGVCIKLAHVTTCSQFYNEKIKNKSYSSMIFIFKEKLGVIIAVNWKTKRMLWILFFNIFKCWTRQCQAHIKYFYNNQIKKKHYKKNQHHASEYKF